MPTLGWKRPCWSLLVDLPSKTVERRIIHFVESRAMQPPMFTFHHGGCTYWYMGMGFICSLFSQFCTAHWHFRMVHRSYVLSRCSVQLSIVMWARCRRWGTRCRARVNQQEIIWDAHPSDDPFKGIRRSPKKLLPWASTHTAVMTQSFTWTMSWNHAAPEMFVLSYNIVCMINWYRTIRWFYRRDFFREDQLLRQNPRKYLSELLEILQGKFMCLAETHSTISIVR